MISLITNFKNHKTVVLFLFFFATVNLSFGQTDSSSFDCDTPIYQGIKVDKEPSFKGAGSMTQFINKSLSVNVLNYIADNKIKGKLILRAIVTKEGTITCLTITKSLDTYLDSEFQNIVKKMEWYPAIAEGQPVNRRITIPIYL